MWTGAFVGAYVGGPCTGAPVVVGLYDGCGVGLTLGAGSGAGVGL